MDWGVGEPLDVVEFFAGVSRICRLAAWAGYHGRGYELKYDQPPNGYSRHSGTPRRSCYDFNGEAGFLFFGLCFFNLMKCLNKVLLVVNP